MNPTFMGSVEPPDAGCSVESPPQAEVARTNPVATTASRLTALMTSHPL